jgi:vitamin B12 transporter
MKKTIIASLVGLAFTPLSTFAETIELDDSLVTATRTPQPKESVIADVTVVTQEQIERSGQSSVIEILQMQPGVEVANSGGYGTVSSIFLRGSNSDHVVILVDGMRINSATTGTAYLSNITPAQIEHIEILRGPASSLYGQDAIGGVIQIFTKKGSGKPSFYGSIGYGSYNTKVAEAGVKGQSGDTRFALTVSSMNTDGYSTLTSNSNTINDKDGYRNLSVSGNLTQKLAEGHEMGIQFFNSNGTAEFDNKFNATNYNSKSDINQQSLAFTSQNQFASFWQSNFRVGYSKDKLKSFDEYYAPGYNRYETEQTQLYWQNTFTLPVGALTLIYDRIEDDLISSDNYSQTSRVNDGYGLSYLANIGSHSIQANLREDHGASYGSTMTGGLGYGYSINQQWRVTSSFGSAFKLPNFNYLYYPYSSNPDLKPEESNNIEASLRYQHDTGSASATVYHNKVRNLIVSSASTGYMPFNLNKATLNGVTFSANQQFGNLSMGGSIDIQSPTDDETGNLLPRRANRNAKIHSQYQWNNWQFGAEALTTSEKYNDAANTRRISGYTLLNLTTQYQINPTWLVQARLNNVFDKDYATAYDGTYAYNNPGANLFVNLRYQPQ